MWPRGEWAALYADSTAIIGNTFMLTALLGLHYIGYNKHSQGYSTCCRGFESHPRQLIFLGKNDCLGCAVLHCCLLALFFFPSSSLINMYMYMYIMSVYLVEGAGSWEEFC